MPECDFCGYSHADLKLTTTQMRHARLAPNDDGERSLCDFCYRGSLGASHWLSGGPVTSADRDLPHMMNILAEKLADHAHPHAHSGWVD